ncbi:unnamed protein product [Prorocentrum cordatum]|uniref:ATP-grasp domain-containing protein n=1 Tax=Prorocentrum cordatum TaxID=2364126 RepID=A0ABN9VKG2_9DINO|nr:unnamed protein product [Polarella glacialis]
MPPLRTFQAGTASVAAAAALGAALLAVEWRRGRLSRALRRLVPGQVAARAGPVVLLTRDEHQQGPWLLDLRRALLALGAEVEVLPLSGFRRPSASWRVLVNRVSDAAPPADVKVCCAALRGAEVVGVPVVNGVWPYTLATSKAMHYELFAAVGAPTPPYVVLRRGGPAPAQAAAEAGLRAPLLLKPSAGGFGKGIVRLDGPDDLQRCQGACEELSAALGEEGVALLQEFQEPDEGCTYRAWFLQGQVHCGVRVRAPSFNACVGGAPHEPWPVPTDIATLCCRMAELAGADCGSVEWLYAGGRPWFFDFNLLSTLPEAAPQGDPYEQLARAVLARAEGRLA